MVRARAGFDELETAGGHQLITPSGALDFGPMRDSRALAGVLAAVGVEHELLSATEARARSPRSPSTARRSGNPMPG